MSKPKIAMIGAGSVVFTLNLLGDILSFPELAEVEIALMDIDAERLRIVLQVSGNLRQVAKSEDQGRAFHRVCLAVQALAVAGVDIAPHHHAGRRRRPRRFRRI